MISYKVIIKNKTNGGMRITKYYRLTDMKTKTDAEQVSSGDILTLEHMRFNVLTISNIRIGGRFSTEVVFVGRLHHLIEPYSQHLKEGDTVCWGPRGLANSLSDYMSDNLFHWKRKHAPIMYDYYG